MKENDKISMVVALIGCMIMFFLSTPSSGYPEEDKLEVPPSIEIRNFEPQPNRLMAVTYANERIFLYQIEKITPRSDCNQVKVGSNNEIIIITQSIGQSHEYVLGASPVMVSEWVRYDN